MATLVPDDWNTVSRSLDGSFYLIDPQRLRNLRWKFGESTVKMLGQITYDHIVMSAERYASPSVAADSFRRNHREICTVTIPIEVTDLRISLSAVAIESFKLMRDVSFLYFFGVENEFAAIHPLGGIAVEDFLRNVVLSADTKSFLLMRSFLRPTQYQRQQQPVHSGSTLPAPAPSKKIKRPHNSTLIPTVKRSKQDMGPAAVATINNDDHFSTGYAVEDYIENPLQMYCKFSSFTDLPLFCDSDDPAIGWPSFFMGHHCSEVVAILDRRVDAMIQVAKLHLDFVTAASRESHHFSKKMSNIVNNVLFGRLPNERRMNVDSLGWLIICGLVLQLSKMEIDDPVAPQPFELQREQIKHWYLEQEIRLFTWRVQYQYPTEKAILHCLEISDDLVFPVSSSQTKLIQRCNDLFAETYPLSPIPTSWYAMPKSAFTDAIADFRVVIDTMDQFCYVCYRHFQQYYLPRLFRRRIERLVYSCECDAEHEAALLKQYNDTVVPDCPTSMDGIRPIAVETYLLLKERLTRLLDLQRQRQTKDDSNEHFAHTYDIEDCVFEGRLPPCTVFLEMRMKERHHLHLDERDDYVTVLLDCGFSAKAIRDRLRKEFVDRGKTTPSHFKHKYGNIVKRKPRENGSTHARYCATQQSDERLQHLQNPVSRTGCPFRFMQEPELDSFLERIGVEDGEVRETVMELKEKRNYKGGCAEVFRYFHGIPQNVVDVHYRPDQYFYRSFNTFIPTTTSYKASVDRKSMTDDPDLVAASVHS